MKRPHILITNDDGIFAPGLRKLISLMRSFGDVTVVAPEKSQSGMSHAVTVRVPLRLRKVAAAEGYNEFYSTGTPVDCVKLGEKVVLRDKPDLVVSGINHGSNASVNILYSGTMAAVIEACIDRIPAIGFSLLDYSHAADFSAVDDFIRVIVKNVLENGLPDGVCLNVNIPAIPREEIRGIKVCAQARGHWDEEFDERIDPHEKPYYWLAGEFKNGDPGKNSDTWALLNNYISVVPVHVDLTAHKAIPYLKKWNLDV